VFADVSSVAEDAEPKAMSSSKEEDCAMSLSCTIKKQLKEQQEHLDAAAEGSNAKVAVNVQQIEDEQSEMEDQANKLEGSYKLLLSGKPDHEAIAKKDAALKEKMKQEKKLAKQQIKLLKPGKARDKAKREMEKNEANAMKTLSPEEQGKAQNEVLQKTNAKRIVSDGERERIQKAEAKKKYNADVEKNTKKSETDIAKSKNEGDAKVAAVVTAQELKQKSAKPVTKAGLVSKAADAKLKHYKAEKKAAQVEHNVAAGVATEADLESAKLHAETERVAAKAAQDLAIQHAMKLQKKMDEAGHPKKSEVKAGGDKLPKSAMAKALQQAEAAIAATEGEAETVKTGEDETAEKKDKTGLTGACSEEACKKTCQTDICYKFCMRCKTIKSEIIKFVPGQGLVTVAGVAAVQKLNDPVMLHAKWMDAAKKEMEKKQEEDAEAEDYASQGIRSQYCYHCKKMCYEKVNGKSRTQAEIQECGSACTGSIACKVGGTASPAYDSPALDGYTEVHKEGGVPPVSNASFTPAPTADEQERANALALADLKEKQKLEMQFVKATSTNSSNSTFESQKLMQLKFMQQQTNLKMKQQAQEIMSLKVQNLHIQKMADMNAQRLAATATADAKNRDAGTVKDMIKKGAMIVKLPSVTVVKHVEGTGANTREVKDTPEEKVASEIREKVNAKAHVLKGEEAISGHDAGASSNADGAPQEAKPTPL